MNKLRRLEGHCERVETGPIQFEDDWPGLFVRGHDSMPIASAIRHLISHVPWQKVIYDKTLFWAVDLLEDFCTSLEQEVIVQGTACFDNKSPVVERRIITKSGKGG